MRVAAFVAAFAVLAIARGLRVTTGGPGYAVFIDAQQGLYAPNFPMPSHAVTIELWTKLLPVRCHFCADARDVSDHCEEL